MAETVWIVGGRIVNAVLLLVALRVMTALLTPEQYGLLALLTAFQGFAGLILVNPTGQYLNRHTHQWQAEGSLRAHIRAYARYWLLVAAGTGVLAAAWFVGVHTEPSWWDALTMGGVVAAAIYLTTVQVTEVSRLNMLGRRRESVFGQLGATFLGLVFSAGSCLVWPHAVSWLAGQALGAWVGYVAMRRWVREIDPERPAKAYSLHALLWQPDFLRFALPLALVTSLMWIEGNGYRLVLERGWSLATLGLFALALSVPAQMTAVLESIVMQLVYPYFFKALSLGEAGAHHARVVSTMVNVLWPLYLLWGAFLWLTASHVLPLLTDSRYHAAAGWVFIGAGTELTRLTINVWQLVSQAEKDFAPSVLPFAIGAGGVLASAGLALYLRWEPMQFGLAMMAALVLKMLLAVIALRRRMPVRVSLRRLAPAAAVLVLSLLAAELVPARLDPLAALVFVALIFGLVAIPVAIHLKTSPDAKYLFSHRLREAA